jgi:hypothetical protein
MVADAGNDTLTGSIVSANVIAGGIAENVGAKRDERAM